MRLSIRNRRKIERIGYGITSLYDESQNNSLWHAQEATDKALRGVAILLEDIKDVKKEKNNFRKDDVKFLRTTLRDIIHNVRLMRSDLNEVVENGVVSKDHVVRGSIAEEDRTVKEHQQRLSVVERALNSLDKEFTLYITTGKRLGDEPRGR